MYCSGGSSEGIGSWAPQFYSQPSYSSYGSGNGGWTTGEDVYGTVYPTQPVAVPGYVIPSSSYGSWTIPATSSYGLSNVYYPSPSPLLSFSGSVTPLHVVPLVPVHREIVPSVHPPERKEEEVPQSTVVRQISWRI